MAKKVNKIMIWKTKENSTIGEKIHYMILENRPALYVLPKKGYHKKYAIFSTHFGSIDNCFWVKENGKEEKITVPDGVAHFLEHKLFDEEEGNIFDRFAAYGASANAFTSFTHTTYLFSCTDFFSENFRLLLEFVSNPYFTQESVDKEQGIIGQEIRMYQDNPDWRVFFNLLEALYNTHPVRKDIAGSVESIAKITKDVLYQCYRTFYHPGNMAIFVIGDVTLEEVLEQVREVFAEENLTPTPEIKRVYPEEDTAINRQRVVQELAVSQPLLNLGFKDTYSNLKGRDLLFRELVAELLLEMIFARSEPLYSELYQEGLIDERFSAGYTAEITYGYTLIGGSTKDPDRLQEKLLAGIRRVKEKGLQKESFIRHKRKARGRFLRSFNSLEFVANNYLDYRFREIDFFEVPDVLETITIEDLEKHLHEHLREGQHAVSIVKPYQ
jgi:predicted Zn-dependent peptidase